MKKRLLICISIFMFLLLGFSLGHATSLLVSDGWGNHKYGGSEWNMTAALDEAFDGNIDVVSNFEDLSLILSYDALWLDIRKRSLNGPCDLLSSLEIENLIEFIDTGKRVVMIGEWGDAYGYSYAAE